MDPKITVENGQFVVENVWAVTRHDDVIILLINCRSKYPEVVECDERLDILPRPESLHLNKDTDDYTRVRITGLGDGRWKTIVETGRYEVRWVLYQAGDDEYTLAWDKGD